MQCEICCEAYTKSCEYSCGHSMCLRCSARMVFLMEKNHCPICSDKNPTLYFKSDKNEQKTETKVNFIFKQNTKIFCESEELKNELKSLLKIYCQKCNYLCDTKANLKFHYKKHKILLCAVCLEYKNLFSDEIELLTYDSISKHNKLHVFCLFCKRYFFNEDTAKMHCVKNHELCVFCDHKKFYEDFKALEKHWRKLHYICSFSECVNDKCYVFKDKAGLMKHMNVKHKINSFSADVCGTEDIVYMSFDKRIDNEERKKNLILNSSIGHKNNLNAVSNATTERSVYNTVNTNILNNMGAEDITTRLSTVNLNKQRWHSFSKLDSLPEYLDRTEIKGERIKMSARLEYLKKKCDFGDDVDKLIEKVNNRDITAEELMLKMEELMDQKSVYKLISSCVSFFIERKAILEALKHCKNNIDFPKLKTVETVEKWKKKKK